MWVSGGGGRQERSGKPSIERVRPRGAEPWHARFALAVGSRDSPAAERSRRDRREAGAK